MTFSIDSLRLRTGENLLEARIAAERILDAISEKGVVRFGAKIFERKGPRCFLGEDWRRLDHRPGSTT